MAKLNTSEYINQNAENILNYQEGIKINLFILASFREGRMLNKVIKSKTEILTL